MSATEESPRGPMPREGAPTPYERMRASPEFRALRTRWLRYVFAMSALFLTWFLVYVLLADFAPDVVNTHVGGTNLTVGLLLGLLQFVSTFAIAVAYARYAEKNLDPTAAELRARVEENL
jgi:uncharacterized membrane protein (DUF485 family)